MMCSTKLDSQHNSQKHEYSWENNSVFEKDKQIIQYYLGKYWHFVYNSRLKIVYGQTRRVQT